MNHFLIMVLRNEDNLLMLDSFIWCTLLIVFHPNAFECLCIFDLNCLNNKCKIFIMFQFGSQVQGSHHVPTWPSCWKGWWPPTPHAIMPRSWRMWLEVSLTSVSIWISSVYCKSTWSLSHSKFACLLTLVITFYSLHWNWAKGLFKTCTFIVVWSWCFEPSSLIDGCLSLLGSMITLQRACKFCTKLYKAI